MVINVEDREHLFNTPVILDDQKIQADGFVLVVQPIEEKNLEWIEQTKTFLKKKEAFDGKPPAFSFDLELLGKIAEELNSEKLSFWIGDSPDDPILVRPYYSCDRKMGYGIMMPLLAYEKAE